MNELFTKFLEYFTEHWEIITGYITGILALAKLLSMGATALKGYVDKLKDKHTSASINSLMRYLEQYASEIKQKQAEFEQNALNNINNQISIGFAKFNAEKREIATKYLGIEYKEEEKPVIEEKIEEESPVIEEQPEIEEAPEVKEEEKELL